MFIDSDFCCGQHPRACTKIKQQRPSGYERTRRNQSSKSIMGRKSVLIEKKAEIAAFLKLLSNISEVARLAKVSRKCVINVAEKIKNRESLENRSGQGRRRISTNIDDQHLLIMAKRDRTQSLRVLAQEWGAAIGKDVSKDTVSRRLRSGGFKSYVQKRKPFRNRCQKNMRRDWCDRMQVWTKEQWAKVIWSDESHFQVINRSGRMVVRRTSKEQDQPFSFRPRLQGGGGNVSVWGCFTASGPGPILAYQGRLTSAAYVNLISAALPQFIDDLSADQEDDWYFQQDNAPCHKAANTLRWFEQQQIRVLPWPPTSPDLNPIENIWAEIERELAKINITSVPRLEEEIKRIWYQFDNEKWRKLSDSVSNRVPKILKVKGGSCSKY